MLTPNRPANRKEAVIQVSCWPYQWNTDTKVLTLEWYSLINIFLGRGKARVTLTCSNICDHQHTYAATADRHQRLWQGHQNLTAAKQASQLT